MSCSVAHEFMLVLHHELMVHHDDDHVPGQLCLVSCVLWHACLGERERERERERD